MQFKNVMKSDLVRSAASLVLCGALFTGGTLAFFTKTVTSEGNTVKTSLLDLTLNNGSTEALFKETDVFSPFNPVSKPITIQNTGELDFDYVVSLEEETKGDTALQQVIEVYVDNNKVDGTLHEILTNSKTIAIGDLVVGEKAETRTIKLKMTEGNHDASLSGKSIGSFKINVTANEKVTKTEEVK